MNLPEEGVREHDGTGRETPLKLSTTWNLTAENAKTAESFLATT